MSQAPQPCRPISDDEKATYERDGVVCLRQVFDGSWVDELVPIARRITIDKEDFGLLPSYPGRYMSRTIPEFRRFVFESAVAEAAARVIGSSYARFFFDEIFAKGPRSKEATIWHNDRMGWPTSGVMVPSIWIPLTPVAEEDSLECILGTQHEDVPYWLFSPNGRQMIRPDDRPLHPDGEARRNDPNMVFKQWAMEPGDILVVHPWTLHYSHGNNADDWRIAISMRIFGEDIRWKPRPDCLSLAGVSVDEMVVGEVPRGPCVPLLWSESGEYDGDAEFPRRFATGWSTTRRTDVNEYEEFKRQQELQGERKAS
ncbi:MAG: phytanoyl-CoA dioxygenase family protein [Pseudomonadota bacterium]